MAALEGVTNDLAGLLKDSREKLGANEGHIMRLSSKVDESSDEILHALTRLQTAQDVHMARSDEKFGAMAGSMTRVIDKLDTTAERLSANESLSQQLRSQNATQFEQLGAIEASMASIKHPSATSLSFMDSPNFRWVVAPVLIILIGLFGLAGYNVTHGAKQILGIPEVQGE